MPTHIVKLTKSNRGGHPMVDHTKSDGTPCTGCGPDCSCAGRGLGQGCCALALRPHGNPATCCAGHVHGAGRSTCRAHEPQDGDLVVPTTPQKRVNHLQLLTELRALNLPNVRDYSVVGAPTENSILDPGGFPIYVDVDGVYPWDNQATAGEYHHKTLPPPHAARVQAAIEAHTPI